MDYRKEFGIKVPAIIIQPNLLTFDKYYVKEEYKHTIDGIPVHIEKGFCFDGASIPWYLWPILGHPLHPQLVTAAAVHDKGYRGVIPKDVADHLFYYIMLDHKFNKYKAKAAYLGVKAFGWMHYRYR